MRNRSCHAEGEQDGTSERGRGFPEDRRDFLFRNFKYSTRDSSEVLEEVGREILPQLEADRPASAVASHAV
jgi:hypothetical protein